MTKFLEEYSVVSKFQTRIGRVYVQALGVKIHPLDHGRGSYEFDVLDGLDRQAAVYYPPDVEFAAALFFQTGWGYYCCQSPRDVEQVREWFEAAIKREANSKNSLVDPPDVKTE